MPTLTVASPELNPFPALFHGYRVVLAFPAIFFWPIEGEDDLCADRERGGGQVEDVGVETGVPGGGVLRGFPVVDAPVHDGGSHENEAKFFVAGDGAGFVVESPAEDLTDGFFDLITLHGLWGLIENLAVAQRAAELDVFGVRPDQRAGGAGGFAAEEFERGDIGGVPDLFREAGDCAR